MLEKMISRRDTICCPDQPAEQLSRALMYISATTCFTEIQLFTIESDFFVLYNKWNLNAHCFRYSFILLIF